MSDKRQKQPMRCSAIYDNHDTMARLRSRRQREGWVRVEVWVPAAMVGKVRQYVRKLTTSDKSSATSSPSAQGTR